MFSADLFAIFKAIYRGNCTWFNLPRDLELDMVILSTVAHICKRYKQCLKCNKHFSKHNTVLSAPNTVLSKYNTMPSKHNTELSKHNTIYGNTTQYLQNATQIFQNTTLHLRNTTQKFPIRNAGCYYYTNHKPTIAQPLTCFTFSRHLSSSFCLEKMFCAGCGAGLKTFSKSRKRL